METIMSKKVVLKMVTIASVAVMSGLLCLACTVGFGPTITKEYNYTDFTKVEVGSAFQVEVVPSDTYNISISAPQNVFDHVDITKFGDTLKIGLTPMSISGSRPKATIRLPDLRGLRLSGATKGNVAGFSSSHDLVLNVSGASALTMDMEAGNTTCEVSGASKITGRLTSLSNSVQVSGASTLDVNGSGSDMMLRVSGASRTNLPEFTLKNVEATVNGASTSVVNVSGKISVDLSGASTLVYHGSPRLDNVSVTGSSTLKQG